MAVIAGEILVDGIDVKKGMSFRIELRQLVSAALSENGVTGVAIACRDASRVRAFVQAIVAAKTARPFFVANVVRISPPIRFHFREEVPFEEGLGGGDHTLDTRFIWIGRSQ